MSAMEDDDEDQSAGTGRYPVMPSLVALQQMKNRLHLARLGKKLMKWTALATGRDLRRIAQELMVTYDSFKEDVGNAFITLARARYYCPTVNKMVIENYPTTASVYVKTSTKSSSGVKTIQLSIIETETTPYEHLGIGRGGTAIKEAKHAWLELLRRMMMMLEHRESFVEVELAHKNATKRQNILQKLIIPRIVASIKYILLELEELAREELYRIKMVKVHNLERARKKRELDKSKLLPEKPEQTEYKVKEIDRPLVKKSVISEDVYLRISSHATCAIESDVFDNFEFLKNQLSNIITLCKGFLTGSLSESHDFPYLYEESSSYASHYPRRTEKSAEMDRKLKSRLDHLKAHLREVIDVTREFRDDTFLTPSVENFVRTCEEVDNKLNIYSKTLNKGDTITEDGKNLLNNLKEHIGEVAKITEEYKNQGILTPSVEDFLMSCNVITAKIDGYTADKEEEAIDENLERIDELKQHVSDLERFTEDVKKEGITSSSIENFLASCKDFKTKLDSYKQELERGPETVETLNKLDETILLSKEAKESGLMAANVESFIETCEETKKLIKSHETKHVQYDEDPQTLEKLTFSIDDVMKLITKYKEQGLSANVDEFLKSCEDAKAKIEVYKRYPHEVEKDSTDYSTCSSSCVCEYSPSYDKFNDMRRPVQKKVSIDPIPSTISDKLRPKSSNASTKQVRIEAPEKKTVSDTDQRLGYFEKKTKIITNINRSQNDDGTIREEKVVTTIKKERKKNVLEKVIVPRIARTIRYILSELEEKEREEIFRLKRFKQLKVKHTAVKDADRLKRDGKPAAPEVPEVPEVCEPFIPEVTYEEPEPITLVIEPEPEPQPELELEPVPEPEPVVPEIKEVEPVFKPCGKPCIMAPKPVPLPEPIESVEVCCSCLSVFEVDENAPEPICPVCKKAGRVRSKASKSKLELKPCESTLYKKRLEDLTTHIDEVINLTKKYKMEGIISPSIEKFIQTCNNTKEKIEDYANIASTCESRQKPPTSRPASATGSQKSVRSTCPDRPTEVPALTVLPASDSRECTTCKPSATGSQKSVRSDAPDKPRDGSAHKTLPKTESEATVHEEELGYFESKYKEVIKVTRLQNEDGTISEERQVITVKTEKKNPRKPDALEKGFGQEKFVGACTCPNYNIRQNISNKDLHITASCNSEKGHRGDEGLYQKSSGIKSPRQTNSEHTPRCTPMVEPKLRACLSAGPEKSMAGDVCKTCLSTISSKEIPAKTTSSVKSCVTRTESAKTCASCPKVSAATSTDSGICCLRKTHSVCSQKLRPHTSKASIGPDDTQKKVTVDKSTYCMPNCCDGKYNTRSCGAVWRDACTSTTNLKVCDSCTSKQSKASTGSTRKKSKKHKSKSDSCCKIKIIIKPQTVKQDDKKCEEAVSVTNSVYDVLNKILPCNQETDKPNWSEIEDLCIKCLEKMKVKPSSCTVCHEPPEDALEMAGPCQSCLSKMKNSKPKQTTYKRCINCQEKLEKALETNELCKRCIARLNNALGQKPSDKICVTCKACKEQIKAITKSSLCENCLTKIGEIAPCRTPSKLTPKASEVKSVEDIEKEICPSLVSSSHSVYCSSVGTDTKTCSCIASSSKNEAIAIKFKRRCLNRLGKKASKVSTRSACCGTCSEQKDASTLTKRCNRFDVRPIRRRHTCEFSAPRTRARQPKKSQSFHETDCNYFKKPKQ